MVYNKEGALAAWAYDQFYSSDKIGDHSFFEQLIREAGGPALEIGFGTGRLLAPYCRLGLEVDGIDASPEMLARCKAKVEGAAYAPSLWLQRMEMLDLKRRYALIYAPFRAFLLVPERGAAFEALSRFRRHLQPDGWVALSMFVPSYELTARQRGQVEVLADRPAGGGRRLLVSASTRNQLIEQLKEVVFRYEIVEEDGRVSEVEIERIKLRWYFRWEFQMMLERVGFGDVRVLGDHSHEPLREGHRDMIFLARA
ncbi:class I SAM-dependent methyltransferase [Myxococcota bacterium]|nr:class I SAM-dependent methyltransferase [Myxococcota bacterium]MBU1431415.1 class I SAM-dependent methyltransferase [Myxococcota bacterium]MBU1897819.1 class I SAM-dependent methyltransferase [Myxococcota bacterium]